MLVVTGSCSDSVKNDDETDVDCGGSCARCADHQSCLVDTDCLSLVCNETKCGM